MKYDVFSPVICNKLYSYAFIKYKQETYCAYEKKHYSESEQ